MSDPPVSRSREDPAEHLPLRAVDFHICLVLAEGPLHGYAMVKRIQERSGGRIRLEPGNLYRYLRRLEDAGAVEPERPSTTRRRNYRLTGFGHGLLAAEAERMRSLASVAAGLARSRPVEGS